MIGRQAGRVCFLRHIGSQRFERPDTALVQIGTHGEPYVRQHFRIVAGTVMVEVAQLIVIGNRVQLMVFQIRQKVARQRQRIQIGIRKRNTVPVCRRAEKARIKVGVMGDQQYITAVSPLSDKAEEHLKRCQFVRRSRSHFL